MMMPPIAARARSLFRPFIAALFIVIASAHAQQGDISFVHDPSILDCNGVFYLFSTGEGIAIRSSTDMVHWKFAGSIFKTPPAWTAEYTRGSSHFWAPDISFVNGEYRVYYAVSTFGRTLSAIGLATNKTLDPAAVDYRWVDRGKVIDTPAKNDWNAIDPCAVLDKENHDWLVVGSCWTGIKIVPLDATTGLQPSPAAKPIAIASRPSFLLLEEGYIRRHGNFYYLWLSYDHCCRGAASNYRIVVGRSSDITGPYVDSKGIPLLKGGGTQVVVSDDNMRGPGSCAIIQKDGRDYLIYHAYDASDHGIPKLQIRHLSWDAEGWPSVAASDDKSP